VLTEIIGERIKQNLYMMSVATQADPEKLRKALEIKKEKSKKLDVVGFERFKQTLSRGSRIGVK